MLQFVNPIWLYASAAVVAPLVIHLWNDRQGKTIRIGSIAFLSRQSRRQSRNIRITEWLLLLLRCLLLIALSLLLAGPQWKQTDPAASAKKGIIFIGDSSAAAVNRILIDSLVQEGYIQQPLTMIDGDWWSSFSEADKRAPATIPVYIFTDAQARHFHGSRPLTVRPVHWYAHADTSGVYRSDVAVWASEPDSMWTTTQTSRATGTTISYRRSALVKSASPDTSSIRVAVIADAKYANDASYIIAGVRAVQQLTHRNVRLSVNEGPAADWVFCLTDSVLPAYTHSHNLFVYARGREEAADTRISGTGISVTRRIQASVYPGEAVWTDAQGRGLLMKRRQGDNSIYDCYTRFNPQYGGLVWSAEWPLLIESMLFGRDIWPSPPGVAIADSNNRRTLDPQQIMPGKGEAREAAMDMTFAVQTQDWSRYVWLIVFVLLVIERLVNYQNKKLTNG